MAKWNSDDILIKDNFLDDETLKNINNDLLLCQKKGKFTNRASTKKGIYQSTYFNVDLSHEHFAVKYVIDFFKKHYGIKILEMESCYFLSTKNNLPSPHFDEVSKINCLIYLKGDQKMANGTGFYVMNKETNTYHLHTHIGFSENRGIIFDGSVKMHGTLQSFENGDPSTRYVMANFINKYE